MNDAINTDQAQWLCRLSLTHTIHGYAVGIYSCRIVIKRFRYCRLRRRCAV